MKLQSRLSPVQQAIMSGRFVKTLDGRTYEKATGARISYDASMSTGYFGISYVIPFAAGGKPGYRINVRFEGQGTHPLFHLAFIEAAPDDMAALWKAVWIYNTFMADEIKNRAIIQARGTKYCWTEADYGEIPAMPAELFDPETCKEQRQKVFKSFLDAKETKIAAAEQEVETRLQELETSNLRGMKKSKQEEVIYRLLDLIDQLRK